jgi:hypothetical protein
LNYSTVGIGSAAHFGAVRLAVSAGITAQHIPFKGPEWLADTIAGRVDFSVPPVIQPEAQHPKSSSIHKPPADYPIFGPPCGLRSDISRGSRRAKSCHVRCSKPSYAQLSVIQFT